MFILMAALRIIYIYYLSNTLRIKCWNNMIQYSQYLNIDLCHFTTFKLFWEWLNFPPSIRLENVTSSILLHTKLYLKHLCYMNKYIFWIVWKITKAFSTFIYLFVSSLYAKTTYIILKIQRLWVICKLYIHVEQTKGKFEPLKYNPKPFTQALDDVMNLKFLIRLSKRRVIRTVWIGWNEWFLKMLSN